MNDDAQLIDEALAGNSAAFGRLVTKYQDRLYNTLVHVVGSTDEAYDAVQDAFVQAFLKLESFHRNSAFYTWLYRIAFNLAISRRRRRKPASSIEQARELTGSEPLSRDDAPTFLAAYQRKGIYERDPFVSIDEKGVGEMIGIAIQRGRAANPKLKIGICGEHAGDPASLKFFAGLGVDYVSCSPYRVPVARLTLAQASA